MRDRFKFRAWECPVEEEDFKGAMHQINPCHFNSFFDYCIERSDEYIVMQCTGLKDKNGELIYEGDIVKYHYKPIGVPHYTKYYNIEQIFLSVIRGIGAKTIARGVYTTKDMPDDLIGNKFADINEYEVEKKQNIIWSVAGGDYKIIGNIHENPELLTNNNPQEE